MVGVVCCVGIGVDGGMVGVETAGVDGGGLLDSGGLGGVACAGGRGLFSGGGDLGGLTSVSTGVAGCSTIASVTINSAFAGRIGNNSQVLEMVMVAFPASGKDTINSFLESNPSCTQSD